MSASTLTQYKSRFTSTRTIAESLRIIKIGDTVSVTTTEDGTLFAKVKNINGSTLTLQILKHNFEPTSKVVKINSSNIVTIKHVSVKHGLGTILK